MENPGALAGASGVKTGQKNTVTETYSTRSEWAKALCFNLGQCHPEDAAAICAAYLDSMKTNGPTLGDPFGMVAGDARFWADCAPIHELAAYGAAALEKLRGLALAKNARKRLFWDLWASFGADDQRAFMAQSRKGGLA